jgi:hypothetical protein
VKVRGTILSAVSVVLLAVFIGNIFFPSIALAAAEINIPVGTIVLLSAGQTIEPGTVTVGQSIQLTVVNDVVVGGDVVIRAGAIATGEVSQAVKEGSIGKPATIALTLRSVEAVDGTTVPLQGMKSVVGENKQTASVVVTILCCILGLLMKGGPAEITQGSTIEATVAIATTVNSSE